MKNRYFYILPFMSGIASLSLGALAPQPAAANDAVPPLTEAIIELQTGWDRAQYQINNKEAQAAALQKLEAKAETFIKAYPQSAEAKIWDGIIYSTDAGVTGGFSSLSKVKKAKHLFEEAIAIDEQAMNGGAHTSLGSLYYKVPGWPVSFGDDDKAKKQLEAALAISPNDIDANYFYGDYLIDQKEYGKALPVLKKAMQAPLRPGRDIADAGRRKEIQADIDIIAEQMR